MAKRNLVMDDKHVSDALHEALRRYPDAERGLIFFFFASGLGFAETSAKELAWAAKRCAELGLTPKSK